MSKTQLTIYSLYLMRNSHYISVDLLLSDPMTLDFGHHQFQPVRTARGQMSYKCPNCSRFYKRESCLKRHIRVECGKAPKYQCRICFSWFKYKHNLTAHALIHNMDAQFQCDLCTKKFYRRDKLIEHKKKWHNVFVNIEWNVCYIIRETDDGSSCFHFAL